MEQILFVNIFEWNEKKTLIYRMVWYVDRLTTKKNKNGVIVHQIEFTDIAIVCRLNRQLLIDTETV